jgi:hypothetical protein
VVLVRSTDVDIDEDCLFSAMEVLEGSRATATGTETDDEAFSSTGMTLSVTFRTTIGSEVTDVLGPELVNVTDVEAIELIDVVIVELKCVDVDDEFDKEMDGLLSCRRLTSTDESAHTVKKARFRNSRLPAPNVANINKEHSRLRRNVETSITAEGPRH